MGYSIGTVLPALAQVDIQLFNQGNATYETEGQQLETISNTIETNSRIEAIAGIRINFDRVSNAKTGLTLGPVATLADNPLSFYFTVINTSNTTNVIRVPAAVSLLNLEVLGASTYTVTNGGNEIVILYDLNGNGQIDFDTDQDGDGVWDALAPDGSPTPDRGPEVWLYDQSVEDYVNTTGIKWSKGTVFLPVNETFQVIVTADIAPNLPSNSILQVILGNSDSTVDSNGDGSPDTDPDTLQDLLYEDDGFPVATDRDVFTVNRRQESDPEDSPVFSNGQREAVDYETPPIRFNGILIDLGIDLSRSSDLIPGNSGTYQAVITSDPTSATVDAFLVVLGGFENVLGNNPQVRLVGAVDAAGTAIDVTNAIVTQQPDGSWLIEGITVAPGTQVTLDIIGTVQPLIADVDFQVDVEVRSPLAIDGITPVFVDSNPANNVDLQPEQLNVDLGIDIEPVGAIVPGTTGSFTVDLTHNGRGAVNEFIIRPSGFEDIFVDGNYAVSITGANGTLLDLRPDQIQLTRQPDGTWRIQILGDNFFLTGQTIELTITGLVTAQVASQQFAATVTIEAPLQTNGLPLFVDTNPANDTDSTLEVLQTDLALDILPPGNFVVGAIGTYGINIQNNGPGSVGRFLVNLTGFENVLGDNLTLNLVGLVDGSGAALSIAGATITRQADGTWLIDGINFRPTYRVQLQVTGLVQPLVADVKFQVQGEVSSPRQTNGTPDFVDTVPVNNIDLEPEQLDVDLAIDLATVNDLEAGQFGQYSIEITNNGPGAVNEFLLLLTDFQTIFTDFKLIPGTYRVSADGRLLGPDGTVINLPIRLTGLTERDGKTPANLSKVIVIITGTGVTPDGSITIQGFTFLPGQKLSWIAEGTVSAVGAAGQEVKVEVDSPLGRTGRPLFVDRDDKNDRDEDRLVDPLGRLVNCDGSAFDATGFTAALFDTNDGGVSVTGLTPLPTPAPGEIEALNLVINANPQNVNPFPFGADGQYNFLFSQEQTNVGRQYVLVITPPANLQSTYSQRRMLLTITSAITLDGIVTDFSYVVRSLDELPVNLDTPDLSASLPGSGGNTGVQVASAAQNFLNVLGVDQDDESTLICQTASLRIQKVADRATAAPGDLVIYRITVENLSTSSIEGLVISDRLPLGFILKEDSLRAQVGSTPVDVTASVSGGVVQFQVNGTLTSQGSGTSQLDLIYATEVTPDALRGRGRNFALVNGSRDDNDLSVSAGPAIATVELRNGLISDYATLIGRVFVDKNFDGEQQEGEPGVPNAVVFLQNGNRIETDKDGLFSVANILPGWYVGTLDLSSVSGYTIAPNAFVLEKESQSRMVRVGPGGMARMNFALTPVQGAPSLEEVQP